MTSRELCHPDLCLLCACQAGEVDCLLTSVRDPRDSDSQVTCVSRRQETGRTVAEWRRVSYLRKCSEGERLALRTLVYSAQVQGIFLYLAHRLSNTFISSGNASLWEIVLHYALCFRVVLTTSSLNNGCSHYVHTKANKSTIAKTFIQYVFIYTDMFR